MDSGRNSAVLNSRFTGPGSAWDKAKERAAHHQKSALRTAAELGTLPSDYCALKGDYTRVSNSTGNPYIDSGPGIQDGIPPTNYPSVHPPNEKAVSDYLSRDSLPTYIRPVLEDKKSPPNIQSHPCVSKKYDFFSQSSINKDNMAVPKPDLREVNYMMPEGLSRLKKTDYANYRPAHEGRIGVEHSLNKSDQPIPSRSWERPEVKDVRNDRYAPGSDRYAPGSDRHAPEGFPQTEQYPQSMEGSKYPDRYIPSNTGQYMPQSAQDPRSQEYPRPEASMEASKYPPDMQPYLSQEYPKKPDSASMERNKYPDERYTPGDSNQQYLPQTVQEPKDIQNYQQEMPYKPEPPKFETEKPKHVNFSEIHKPEGNFESMAIKGLKRIRTTNQTYGSWIGDPFLEGKDWYRSPRFPHVKSYLTKHREESGSWM